MKPDEGRLQTAEHILAKLLEDKINDAIIGIAKFNENLGILEVNTSVDLRKFDVKALELEVNQVISRNLLVSKSTLSREDAAKQINLRKVPESVKQVRIIDISGFDKRPCRDPHVDNTKKIGKFSITKLKRAGSNRYRFTLKVE